MIVPINLEHQRQKIVISIGIVASSTLAVAAPAMTTHAVILGILTNLIWVWV